MSLAKPYEEKITFIDTTTSLSFEREISPIVYNMVLADRSDSDLNLKPAMKK